MFTIPKIEDNILDTFLFDRKGICFKSNHARRTFEAYQLCNKTIPFESMLQKYNALEIELAAAVAKTTIVRVVFTQDYNFSYSLVEYKPFSKQVTLQLIYEPKHPSGLGPQNFKWQNRTYWESIMEKKKPNAIDVIVINDKEFVVESSRFNLFAYDKNTDRVFTPTLASGCINGVYRRFCVEQGFIDLSIGRKTLIERDISVSEISNYQLFVANSVRGVLPAELIS